MIDCVICGYGPAEHREGGEMIHAYDPPMPEPEVTDEDRDNAARVWRQNRVEAVDRIAKAFARLRQESYDEGYNDCCEQR